MTSLIMPLNDIQNIILVLSGKGGVGKSSITTQLALSLCLAGHSVGILDVDLTGPSIPRFLGLEDAKVRQAPGGWLPVEVHGAQFLRPLSRNGDDAADDKARNGGGMLNGQLDHLAFATNSTHSNGTESTSGHKVGPLHAISLGFLLPSRDSAVVWRGPKKTAMVRQFLSDVKWPDLNYLLIDTPPGTSDEHISLAETLLAQTSVKASSTSHNTTHQNDSALSDKKPNLAGALIVTTPQAISTADVRKEINFCHKTGIPLLGVLENMAGYMCECCGEVTNVFGKGGGEVMAQEMEVRFLGGVPLDPGGWGALIEEGRRPRKFVATRDGGDAGEQEGAKDEAGEEIQGQGGEIRVQDDGSLLVDKYRNCMLYDVVMKGVASEVARLVSEVA